MISLIKSIKSYLKQQSGFSMVEVLIAVAIVGTGMLAYGSLSGTIINTNANSSKKSIAITLAQDKIEELRNLTLMVQDLSTALGDTNPAFNDATAQWETSADEVLDSEGQTTGNLLYTRTWTLVQSTSNAALDADNHLFDAKVIVSWDSNGGQSVTLDSKISD
jgi:type IV pilus modification protein PilV